MCRSFFSSADSDKLKVGEWSFNTLLDMKNSWWGQWVGGQQHSGVHEVLVNNYGGESPHTMAF